MAVSDIASHEDLVSGDTHSTFVADEPARMKLATASAFVFGARKLGNALWGFLQGEQYRTSLRWSCCRFRFWVLCKVGDVKGIEVSRVRMRIHRIPMYFAPCYDNSLSVEPREDTPPYACTAPVSRKIPVPLHHG